MCGCAYAEESLICPGMVGSLNMGRFQVERSMVERVAVVEVEVKEGRVCRVEVTNEAICGQTRGWRVEQMITAIEGVFVDVMVTLSCCKFTQLMLGMSIRAVMRVNKTPSERRDGHL